MPKDPIGPAAERELQRIGLVIASVRAWRNLSQEDLRELARVSISQVKRMEHGRSDPAISFYMRIANALNVPLHWLFADDWRRFVAEQEARQGSGAGGGEPPLGTP